MRSGSLPANVVRLRARKSRARKSSPTSADTGGRPTDERLAHAQGHVEVGNDGQGRRIYTLRDSPLERLSSRGAIDHRAYAALMKFKQHWTFAGLQPALGNIDLARLFSGDLGDRSGMAKTERQVFHRQRYRQAVQEIGMRGSFVVERVVCAEQSLEAVGTLLHWQTPAQARAVTTELLRDAGERLARLWGIG